ncbi:peptidyl-tRNA hydrolase [Nanoarchaeota archaeon]|nr:MAG: peptidyl-tRNA hydrolase [Nanoarchaeota archaeon]
MFKQVIVVRGDLKMSKGKMAAQVAHGSLSASIKVMNLKPSWFRIWNQEGQKKVVLVAKDLKELEKLEKKAREKKLYVEFVVDRGLTEVEPGTVTCLVIGPGPEELIDKVTGSLPLLK